MNLAFLGALLAGSLPAQEPEAPSSQPALEELRAATGLAGLAFTEEELLQMVQGAASNLRSYEALRAVSLDNAVPPALLFQAGLPGREARGWEPPAGGRVLPWLQRPADLEELAFASLDELGFLIRTRQVSCLELTRLFLDRLRRLDPVLRCVVHLTEERALKQAAELDAELEKGHYRGPLHGIPYGAKDLFAVPGYPTTWGAAPFREQDRGEELAAVIERLDRAGAVLVAKLSLGALAMGDRWFAARTRNPWNPAQGSSGSSAGSAAATAAGLVPFSLGTETLGSIVSPCTRCGCTGLRPTFGTVSRYGAMALSWTMDKVGPICRSARDAALVYDVLHGADPRDPYAVDHFFRPPPPVAVQGWRIGYPAKAFEEDEAAAVVLEELRVLGVELVPVEIPEAPVWEMMIILNAEAATAFDELTRSDRDDELVDQGPRAWPNSFRTARLIPAVEYLRAQRLRFLLMADYDRVLDGLDALVHPSYGAGLLGITNLTGHPAVVAPAGFREDGTPRSITFTGHWFDEARLLALVEAWQAATPWEDRHPDTKALEERLPAGP